MATIDYTKIDQDEVRDELITLLKQTDSFKDASFTGTVLYDFANVLSYNASLFGYYLNQIANEPFIDTAKQYKNINRIANSLLYYPIGKGSSQVAIASRLSKEYVLNNTEGFIEIPTYSQFPSTRTTVNGDFFAFTNFQPLTVQVKQYGVNFIKESDIQYVGEITGISLDSQKLIIQAQPKRPAQIVASETVIDVVEETITSIAHETLSTFVVGTIYSMVMRKVSGVYYMTIMPKTSTVLTDEIFRFKINSDRSVTITQNFSSNKMYMGRLGYRNLIYSNIEAIPMEGIPDSVSKIQLIVPRYSPALEILINGTVYSFSSSEEDIIIYSDDIQSGDFVSGQDVNIILYLSDLEAKYYGAKLLLKTTSDVLDTDVVIAKIPGEDVEDGNIVVRKNYVLSGTTKTGKVEFLEGETSKRVVFETPFDFGLTTDTIPVDSLKNYSIFIYANDNVQTFYTNKTTKGMVINVEPERGFTGTVYWTATEYTKEEVQASVVDISVLKTIVGNITNYGVLLQPGVNTITWATDIISTGFKINSDISFVGDVDYLVIPNGDLTIVGSPALAGVEYIPSGVTELEVKYDKVRQGTTYQLFLKADDNVNIWFENKSSEGFLLRIDPATDFTGKVEWQLYESPYGGTVSFGGSDKYQGSVNISYQDLLETSYLGYLSQGLAKMSIIDETGLINSGVNDLVLDYNTDITVNPGLSFEVTDTTISYNNIRVFVKVNQTWVEWTEAKNYKNKIDENSQVFYVRINKDQKISLKFGNNDVRGYSPLGSKISIIGMECVGEEGNIGENVLNTEIIGSLNFQVSSIVTDEVEENLIDLLKIKKEAFFDGESTAVVVDYKNRVITSTELTVAQLGNGVFGTEPENVEGIRNNAQLVHRSQDRLVSTEDYQVAILNNFSNFILDVSVFNYKQAKEANLIPEGDDPNNYFNTLFFMIVPLYGNSFTLAQREVIKTFIDDRSKKFTSVESVVLEPSFIPIDVMISYSEKVGASSIEVRNAVTSGVYSFFERKNRKLGETITIYNIQQNIVSTDLTEINIQLKRDQDNKKMPSDYNVNITPDQFEDRFADVEQQKLQAEVQKQIRNMVEKGLIDIKAPLFSIQMPTGNTEWPFVGDVKLSRFEFPILGDLVIEKMVK